MEIGHKTEGSGGNKQKMKDGCLARQEEEEPVRSQITDDRYWCQIIRSNITTLVKVRALLLRGISVYSKIQ